MLNFLKRETSNKVVMQIVNDTEQDAVSGYNNDTLGVSISSRPAASIFQNNLQSIVKSDFRSNLVKFTKQMAKSELVNKKIVLNPFEKVFKMRIQRYNIYFVLMIFGILVSIAQVGWFMYLYIQQTAVFTLGIYIVFVITLFHLSAFLIKRCIFDKGLSSRGRSLKIWWLCCLKVTDPYDVENHTKKVREKNKKMKSQVRALAQQERQVSEKISQKNFNVAN